MRCQDVQDNISAFLDGELSQDAAEEIGRHVEECAVCRDLLNSLRSVSALVGDLPREQAPRSLSEDVQAQLERRLLFTPDGDEMEPTQATERALAHERPPAWPRVAAIAACLFLAAGIGLLLNMDHGNRPIVAKDTSTDKADVGDRVAMLEAGRETGLAAGGTRKGYYGLTTEDAADAMQLDAKKHVSRDAGKADEKGLIVDGGGGGKAKYFEAEASSYANRIRSRRIGAAGVTDVHTLVIETSGDLAAVEKDLTTLFSRNGMTLTRAKTTVTQAAVPDSDNGRISGPEEMAEGWGVDSVKTGDTFAYDNAKADAVQTIMYSGSVPVDKAVLLAYEIAGSQEFEVTEGRGLFITTGKLQKTRLANAELRKSVKGTTIHAVTNGTAPALGDMPAAARALAEDNAATDIGVPPLEAAPAVAEAYRIGQKKAATEAEETFQDSAQAAGDAGGAEAADQPKAAANEMARERPAGAGEARGDKSPDRDDAEKADKGEKDKQADSAATPGRRQKATDGDADAVTRALESDQALVEKKREEQDARPADAMNNAADDHGADTDAKEEQPPVPAAPAGAEPKAEAMKLTGELEQPAPTPPGGTAPSESPAPAETGEGAARKADEGDGETPAEPERAAGRYTATPGATPEVAQESKANDVAASRARRRDDTYEGAAAVEGMLGFKDDAEAVAEKTQPAEETMFIVVRLVVRPAPSTDTTLGIAAKAAREAAAARVEMDDVEAKAANIAPEQAIEDRSHHATEEPAKPAAGE